jgi:putative DNA primase/helicase
LYEFLDKRCYYVVEEKRKPVNPSPKLVNAVLDCLRARAHLPTTVSAPAWLDGATEDQQKLKPKDIVSCSNGLLYLPTMALLAHTPKFFSHNALEFPYNKDAPAPIVWHEFIGQLWPGDFDACNTLHEMFGYFLTGDTSQQKIFFIIGPRRSGKGTIAKVLRSLLGPHNCTAPTLAGIGETFGLQPLIGKLAAIIGDARLGGKIDQNAIVERLLSISGEDDININRKNASFWVGRLISRLLILSNEIPKLTDASSALVGRFVILRLTESFYGREDKGLFERLEPELPGILNLAIAGWHRLRQRGYFEQPASSNKVAEQFADISSPIKQFVRERCELDSFHAVSVDALFDAWCAWCKDEGRNYPGTKSTFKNDMSTAFPEIQSKHLGPRGAQTLMYQGIKLATVPGIYTLCIWGIDFNDNLGDATRYSTQSRPWTNKQAAEDGDEGDEG